MKPQPLSFLDDNLDDISMPKHCTIPPPTSAFGVFLRMSEFHSYLDRHYKVLDVMTYGATPDSCSVPVRRAVIGLSYGRTGVTFKTAPLYVKYFSNVHAKIVIAYHATTEYSSYDVFVGSHNFVGATIYDLMMQVTTKQALYIKDFYESFWAEDSKITKHLPKGDL